jgi:hypothetical protein
MALNGDELGNKLIQELGIPEPAQPKIRQLANIIVNYLKEKGEIDIADIQIQVNDITAGSASANAAKLGKGKIQ